MGFINDVATNIKSAASTVGEKAVGLYDVSRHTYTANGIKADIKKKLYEFGKSVYENYKDGEDADFESLSEQIAEIDALYLQLDSVNELIAEAKNLKTCPNCGTQASKDAQFCAHCGEKI